MTRHPTDRQKEIYEFMIRYQDDHGAPPSMREISAHIGAKSTNAANDHLRLMERKGLVRRYPNRSRAWVPIRKTEPCETP